MVAAIGVYRGPLGKYMPDGTYGGAVGSGVLSYESWVNKQMDYVQDYAIDAPSSWSSFENGFVQPTVPGGNPKLSDWTTFSWGTRKLMYATCAVAGRSAGSGATTWAGEASGTNDAHWTALGNNLILNGFANACIRIGREWNGSWYPWSPQVTGDTPATYISGYSHIVTVLKACAGANFTFCWNPTLGNVSGVVSGNQDPKLWYPGNAYVDMIGINYYDWYAYATLTAPPYTRTTTEQNNNFNTIETLSPGGLQDWQTFATSKSKPLAYPEWGLQLWLSGGNYLGGGDDVVYIDRMWPYIRSSNFQCMWEDLGQGIFDPDTNWRRTSTLTVSNARTEYLKRLPYLTGSGSAVLSLDGDGVMKQLPMNGTAFTSSSAAGRMLHEILPAAGSSLVTSRCTSWFSTPLPFIEPPTGPQGDVTVQLLDGSLNPLMIIDFASLTATLYYNAVGSWSMVVPFSQPLWDAVSSGDCIIDVDWRGMFSFGGKCEVPGYSDSIPGAANVGGSGNIPGPVITLSGADYLALIANRIAYPAPGVNWPNQAAISSDKIGPVPCETAIKHYVSVNAGPGALASRQVTLLDMENDAGRGANVSYNAQFQAGVSLNLMDVIRLLITNGGPMGVDIRLDTIARRLIFECYVPRDLSNAAWFSESLGNLTSVSLSLADPTVTDALIRASGSKNFLTANNTNFEASTGTWVSAGNCTIARVSTNPHSGGWCMYMRAVAPGMMWCVHCDPATVATWGLQCRGGDSISSTAYIRAGSSPRLMQIGVAFYDATNAWISTLYGPVLVGDTTTGWTLFTTGEGVTAPDGAVHAIMQVQASVFAVDNFLTGNNVDFEVNTGTWVGAVNGNVSRSTINPYAGNGCMRLRSPGNGSMSAIHCTAASAYTFGLQVTPGDIVSASCYARCGNTPRYVDIGIAFYNSSNTWLGTLFGNVQPITDSTQGWIYITNGDGVVAPDGSVHAIMQVQAEDQTSTYNFLTGNNTTFDASTGTWTFGSNIFLACVGTNPHWGPNCMRMRSGAAGQMYAVHCSAATVGTYGMPCIKDDYITAAAYVRAGTVNRAVFVGVVFYDSGGAFVATLYGNAGNMVDDTSGWSYVTNGDGVITPDTARYAVLQLQVNGTGAANEDHFWDDAQLINHSAHVSNIGAGEDHYFDQMVMKNMSTGGIRAGEYHYIDDCTLGINKPGGKAFVASSGPSSQWDKIEQYVDQSTEADATILAQVGADTLASGQAGAALAVTATDLPFLTYGRDYGLGDKVTVEVRPGDTYTDIISSVTLNADPSQTPSISIVPTIGYASSAGSSDQSITNQLVARVRDIERRINIQK